MFILRSDGGFLQAAGIRKQLTGKAASLDMQARTFFRDWRKDEGPALLVGALPFNNDRDHLVYQPDDVWRSPSLDTVRLSVGASATATPVRFDNFRSIPSARGYADNVIQALEAMRDGDLQKVVLARRLSARLRGHIDPLHLLDRLAIDPSAALFLLNLACGTGLPPHYLVGATPELLIRRQGRNILSNPLAGSARRLPDAQQDRDAGQALLQSEKDRREHRLVVDYIADCLSPYCAQLVVGSPSLHSTATMWHLGTRIEGRLREEDAPGAAGLAALLHPTPAVGGVPQAPALEAIARLEGQDRGFYAGALGSCDRDGDGAWYVTLRCAEMEADHITLHAGAGIVPGSDPQAEVNETAAKFRAMLRALDLDEAAFEETVLS